MSDSNTKKLHELLSLAKAGKKFRATYDYSDAWSEHDILAASSWPVNYITADWTYKEIKDPIKLEFEAKVIRHEYAGCSVNNLTLSFGDIGELYLNGKRFKVTMQELI